MIRKVSTGISPQYVKNWTVVMGMREVIQNYLDSRKEFGCEGHIKWEKGLATVKDYGPGLEPRHLALGVSEKGGDCIGKYGEGLKLALMVLAREGRNIEIWSKGIIIKPTIEFDQNFGTEVMVLNIRDMAPRHAATHTGTSIKFECTEYELKLAKAFFEHFLTKAGRITWLEKDKISLPAGFIYVNGAVVGKIDNALFSYHLRESEVGNVGNRDREVIDQGKVNGIIQKMISTTTCEKIITKMLKDAIKQADSFEAKVGINNYLVGRNGRKIWKKVWNRVIGSNSVIAKNDATDREASYKGYHVVRLGWKWEGALEEMGIPTTHTVITNTSKASQCVAISTLTPEEKKNLDIATKLVETHYNTVGKVKVSSDLRAFSGASDMVEVNGCYSNSNDTIYLLRDILTDLQQTIHTLLHEAVHKHSGTNDCTAEFESALTNVAVAMMMRTI